MTLTSGLHSLLTQYKHELHRVMLHQPGRAMVVFSKKLNSLLEEAA